jgi:hypothetical protein
MEHRVEERSSEVEKGIGTVVTYKYLSKVTTWTTHFCCLLIAAMGLYPYWGTRYKNAKITRAKLVNWASPCMVRNVASVGPSHITVTSVSIWITWYARAQLMQRSCEVIASLRQSIHLSNWSGDVGCGVKISRQKLFFFKTTSNKYVLVPSPTYSPSKLTPVANSSPISTLSKHQHHDVLNLRSLSSLMEGKSDIAMSHVTVSLEDLGWLLYM